MGCDTQMTEAAFPSLISKVSYDDYPTRPVTNHKAAPASPVRAPAQQQRQQAPAVREQIQTPRHNRHNATAAVNQQPPQPQPQQRQALVMSTPRRPPAQQATQLPDPRWSSSGNSPSQSPHKQPPQKPHSLRSALPPGYMPQPRRVAQQPMTEQPAMTAASEHVQGLNRQNNGINYMPGGQPTCWKCL